MKEMTKEQRSRMVIRWRLRKIIAYCIAYIIIAIGTWTMLWGALGSYKTGLVFIVGVFIIFIGILIWTYFYENKFSSYCEKKGL